MTKKSVIRKKIKDKKIVCEKRLKRIVSKEKWKICSKNVLGTVRMITNHSMDLRTEENLMRYTSNPCPEDHQTSSLSDIHSINIHSNIIDTDTIQYGYNVTKI